MTGRKAILGISVLCALAFSAIAASNASAITAWTCQPNELAGQQQFSDAHCLNEVGGNRGYKHVEITPGSITQVELVSEGTSGETTASTPTTIEGAVAGVATAISCATVRGTGPLQNATNGAEMYITITFVLEHTSCTVTKPAGKGCVVNEGKFTSKELTATTKEQGGEYKVAPTSGTEIASIKIEKCSVEALNNSFALSGSYKVKPAVTLNVTHAGITAQNTLKFAGVKAGLAASLTVKMDPAGGVTSHAITAT